MTNTTKQPHRFSIEFVGMATFLNRPKAVARHNGYTYDDFVRFLSQGVNPSNMQKLFGRSRPAIMHWLEVYFYELCDQGHSLEDIKKQYLSGMTSAILDKWYATYQK